MKSLYATVLALLVLPSLIAQATYESPDPDALERIYVERYYISDEADACDTDGGSLPVGSVTYRVFADLKPDYLLETIYGTVVEGNAHPLTLSTTTEFFNNEDRGETQGGEFSLSQVNDNTVALDSYLAFGYSVQDFYALPKDVDTDGSILGGMANDGGSCATAEGLLINTDSLACEPITLVDGMIPMTSSSFITVNLASNDTLATENSIHMFDDVNSGSDCYIDNGAWAALGGLGGVTEENMILIGQFTTDGEFSFELNMRVRIPAALQCDSSICPTNIDYYAQLFSSDTLGQPNYVTDRLIQIPSLVFNSSTASFNCSTTAVGVTEENAVDFAIFPNPVEDFLTVQLKDETDGAVQLSIIDLQGRVVMTERQTNAIMTSDVSTLPAGVYILELRSSMGTSTSRFIKE